MKKFLGICLVTLLTSASSLFALDLQTEGTNRINFRINPLGPVADTASGGLDLGLTENLSLGVDAGYSYDTSKILGVSGKAYSGGLRLSYYVDSMNDDSFISSVGLNKTTVELDLDEQDAIEVYTGDLKAGYRWLWDSGFNVQLSGGFAQAKLSNPDLPQVHVIAPVAEFNFGIQV